MENHTLSAFDEQLHYLQLLSRQFPNIRTASREIINLKAILNLPKGTEHFLSDLHGEYEAFVHLLKNGSGIIRRKIDDVFGNSLESCAKKSLATLIYYPEEVLGGLEADEPSTEEWYERTLHQLILVCREASSKYTRSKVRKAMPLDFQYIIEELLHEQDNVPDKHDYYDGIVKTIIQIGQAKPFIIALCELIQRLSVDRLHILGDIYDRGPGADIIMDKMLRYHSIDIQWGNHDIGWMGAAAGSPICIANTIRMCARYGNLSTLEDSYGINLFPLVKFAMDHYPDSIDTFEPKPTNQSIQEDSVLIGKVHKAITIIQFKLEGQLIRRNPHYKMESRLHLDQLDLKNAKVRVAGKWYPIMDTYFPTLDSEDPYRLSPQEEEVMHKLTASFMRNEKLQKHVDFLFSKGNIYLTFNGNLLFHGCIPMDENGGFETFEIEGIHYGGKALLDTFERKMRECYENRWKADMTATDIFWYLCTGEKSPLFGKKNITTFERYFILNSKTHHEDKNPYYRFISEEKTCDLILHEFGLYGEDSRIINGHVPVKVRKGESPIKAGGKLLVIDGGMSKAYQNVTGIAGYTLIYNSYGMVLAAHEPFISKELAIKTDVDLISKLMVLYYKNARIKVRDTDIGKELQKQIDDLELLVHAYAKGIIKQM